MTYDPETRILCAAPGKWVTNGETYAIEAKLAPSEDVAHWREIDEAEVPAEPQDDEYENTEPEE